MKLENVKDITKNEYPKRKEIDNKKLKNNIPSRWKKSGITALAFGLIMSQKSYAVEINDMLPTPGVQKKVDEEIDIKLTEENNILEDDMELAGDVIMINENDSDNQNIITNETILAGDIISDNTNMSKTIGTFTTIVSITGVVAISSLIGIAAFKIKKRKKDK